MLGQKILDPQQVESTKAEVSGLGLLDVITTFAPEKSTRQVRARVLSDLGLLGRTKGLEITGYEIHMGQTRCEEPLNAFQVYETPQGATDYGDGTLDARGNVLGTYMHGLFYNTDFRRAFLNTLRRRWGLPESQGDTAVGREPQYDRLADLVRHSLNMAEIYKIAGVKI